MTSDTPDRGGAAQPTSRPNIYRLQLLDGFRLIADSDIVVPTPAQRLVAYLALRDTAFHRRRLANFLWLDISEDRAFGNLRSTLWRLGKRAPGIIDCDKERLCLSPNVSVDVHDALDVARTLLSAEASTVRRYQREDVALLSADLLPDWSEDWVIVERERVRQVRLHSLEALCRTLMDSGDYCGAVEAALAAVAGEPLRETATHVLVEVHLREGNVVEALRQYAQYSSLLRHELGIEPSENLCALVRSRLPATAAASLR